MPSFVGLRHHRMRAYLLPLVAGVVLAGSAFLPRVRFGGESFGAVPDMSGLWTLGLGFVAVLLATLSFVTRKNSRHPLLLVGLVAIGLEFLGWQWTERTVTEQAWANAQAAAIVEGEPPPADLGRPTRGAGLYLGVCAASAIALFGLTIVLKQVATPYAVPEDDR
jgi:hypothetical protein